MSKGNLRILLTVLMYVGVLLFLYPYVWGTLSRSMLLLLGGAALTITCGLLRAVCQDGDCSDRVPTRPGP
jgi:hypothetical protein